MVPAQDTHSGLQLDPGCTNLDGSTALAYARSRYYEEWIDDDWQRDGTADLGRIRRQQLFIRTAVDKLLATMESDPFKLGQLIDAGASAVKVDATLDPVQAAAAMRQAAAVGLVTYSLPVDFAEHGDQSALDLREDEAQPILDYFRGVTTTPPPVPTTAAPATDAGDRAADGPGAAGSYTSAPYEGPDPRRRRGHPPATDHAHAGQATRPRSPTSRSCSTASTRWSPPGSRRSVSSPATPGRRSAPRSVTAAASGRASRTSPRTPRWDSPTAC